MCKNWSHLANSRISINTWVPNSRSYGSAALCSNSKSCGGIWSLYRFARTASVKITWNIKTCIFKNVVKRCQKVTEIYHKSLTPFCGRSCRKSHINPWHGNWSIANYVQRPRLLYVRAVRLTLDSDLARQPKRFWSFSKLKNRMRTFPEMSSRFWVAQLTTESFELH